MAYISVGVNSACIHREAHTSLNSYKFVIGSGNAEYNESSAKWAVGIISSRLSIPIPNLGVKKTDYQNSGV